MGAGTTGPAKDAGQKKAFEEMSGAWGEEVRALARRARALVLEVAPEAVEIVWPQQSEGLEGHHAAAELDDGAADEDLAGGVDVEVQA